MCVCDWQLTEAVLTSLIAKHVSGAKLIDNLSSEMTYQLPDDPRSVAKFNSLFHELDLNLSTLGISGYGISNTTLEEVPPLLFHSISLSLS